MERQEIETFLALCEELHFGRTAKRLRISPARVTQLIQKTERRIGGALFERTTRGVVPTALGEQLRRDLAPAQQAVEEAVQLAAQAAKGIGGELRLGFLGTANGRHLAELSRAFEAGNPESSVRMAVESEIVDHLRPLRDDRVDVLATLLPVEEPGLVVGPVVVRERLLMAVPEGHPIAKRGVATYEDLADHPVLLSTAEGLDYWVNHFVPQETPSGRPVGDRIRIDSLQAGLALVASGKGIGPIITQFAQFNQHPGIAYVPLEGAPLIESALIWKASRETGLVRAFARLAENRGPVTLDWNPAA
ncbi:LysR family transcriptional regulator [Glycomyces dulcitolivorans]|uniref:LysR family transcriptional regulator n=1 Tax=Glycomyces dulcitolivorans TaxID=2200759 RepID=UPI000DD44AE7|nr:LysR family transcriptional regulator [Glycomyces dulcitolivorans]